MKLHWGHKLTFFAGIFMLFVVFMVYRISSQQIDLVDQHYYERGVKYQEELNKFDAAQKVHPVITYSGREQQLQLAVQTPHAIKGRLYIYRPSDAALDGEAPFETNASGIASWSTAALTKGVWKATFEWTLDGTLMATEYSFRIE